MKIIVIFIFSWSNIVYSQNTIRDDEMTVGVQLPTASPFKVGSAVLAPASLRPMQTDKPVLSCKTMCSPFEPRQSLVEVRWPEKQQGMEKFDVQNLRLDIIGGASKYEVGEFGTVRIGAIHFIQAKPGSGVNLKTARSQLTPALIQRVKNNKIIPRSPNLPSPDELKKERVPKLLNQMPLATQEAMVLDLKEGGFGRMQVVGQSIVNVKSILHRNLILEGMQPGLTYKLRLVNDASANNAASIDERICRVPVCPADFEYSP